jgi:hypothetical protein
MKILAAVACGAALGVVGVLLWLMWYFRDVYK